MAQEVEYKSVLYDVPYQPLGGLPTEAEKVGAWLNEWAATGWHLFTMSRLGGLDREESRFLVVFERAIRADA